MKMPRQKIILDLVKISINELFAFFIDQSSLVDIDTSLVERQLKLPICFEQGDKLERTKCILGLGIVALVHQQYAAMVSEAIFKLSIFAIEDNSKLKHLVLATIFSRLGNVEMMEKYKVVADKHDLNPESKHLSLLLEKMLNNEDCELDVEINKSEKIHNQVENKSLLTQSEIDKVLDIIINANKTLVYPINLAMICEYEDHQEILHLNKACTVLLQAIVDKHNQSEHLTSFLKEVIIQARHQLLNNMSESGCLLCQILTTFNAESSLYQYIVNDILIEDMRNEGSRNYQGYPRSLRGFITLMQSFTVESVVVFSSPLISAMMECMFKSESLRLLNVIPLLRYLALVNDIHCINACFVTLSELLSHQSDETYRFFNNSLDMLQLAAEFPVIAEKLNELIQGVMQKSELTESDVALLASYSDFFMANIPTDVQQLVSRLTSYQQPELAKSPAAFRGRPCFEPNPHNNNLRKLRSLCAMRDRKFHLFNAVIRDPITGLCKTRYGVLTPNFTIDYITCMPLDTLFEFYFTKLDYQLLLSLPDPHMTYRLLFAQLVPEKLDQLRCLVLGEFLYNNLLNVTVDVIHQPNYQNMLEKCYLAICFLLLTENPQASTQLMSLVVKAMKIAADKKRPNDVPGSILSNLSQFQFEMDVLATTILETLSKAADNFGFHQSDLDDLKIALNILRIQPVLENLRN